MNNHSSRLSKLLPFILGGSLAFVWFIVTLVNFPYGKWFIGWDALSPEFNNSVNLERVFTSLWQENEGLGLLGGHGYAAVLPHVLTSMVLTPLVSPQAVRPVFTFLMLLTGTLGVYALGYFVTRKFPYWLRAPAAFIGGMYYLLCLGTVQVFYLQLEAFIVHYAFLPWLILAVLRFLEQPTKRRGIILALLSFVSSVQGFIPPVFVVYLLCLGLICLSYLAFHHNRQTVKRIVILGAITFCTNAFWLLPFLYYTATHASITLSAYNNMISTQDFIDKNQKFGTLSHVPLIQGFIFDSLQTKQENGSSYVFDAWRTFYQRPGVLFIGYAFFVLALVGCLACIKKKADWTEVAMGLMFLCVLTGISKAIPPFSYINMLIDRIPLINQAFRSPFTKFAPSVALMYALMITLGVAGILSLLHRLVPKTKGLVLLVVPVLFVVFMYYSAPTFTGHFLYDRLTLSIPKAYTDIMEYFKTQDPNRRIALLPQDCADGWHEYRWGYVGSGFYWYGIKQPILDQSFSVWSNTNENYYWEMNQLLRSRQFDALIPLMNKYDISWLLYDPNELHCKDSKGFTYADDMTRYLMNSPMFTQQQVFTSDGIQPILLFEKKELPTNSYVSFTSTLPNVHPLTSWNDADRYFSTYGAYTTDDQSNPTIYYPFRSLFSKRGSAYNEFSITETPDLIQISNPLYRKLTNYVMTVPNPATTEAIFPAALRLIPKTKTESDLVIDFHPATVSVNGLQYGFTMLSEGLGTIQTDKTAQATITINDAPLLIPDTTKSFTSNLFLLFTKRDNYIQVTDSHSKVLLSTTLSAENLQAILPEFVSSPLVDTSSNVTVSIPKVYQSDWSVDVPLYSPTIQVQPCDDVPNTTRTVNAKYIVENDQGYLHVDTRNGKDCLTVIMNNQNQNTGYIVMVESRTTSGRPPLLEVRNQTVRGTDLEVYLPSHKDFAKEYFILPPSYINGLGRTLTLQNISYLNSSSVTDIQAIKLWPIPFSYIQSIAIKDPLTQTIPTPVTADPQSFTVSHPNEVYYEIQPPPTTQTLVLSQSFDPGWKAYRVSCGLSVVGCELQKGLPFLFGKPLGNHILVNNWANGWELEPTTNIVIFYLPQVLEWLGFALLPFTILFLFF